MFQTPGFPQCGNIFSIVWKIRENVFHTVENPSHSVSCILDSEFCILNSSYIRLSHVPAVMLRNQRGFVAPLYHSHAPSLDRYKNGYFVRLVHSQPMSCV